MHSRVVIAAANGLDSGEPDRDEPGGESRFGHADSY